MGVLIHAQVWSNETKFFDLDEVLDVLRPWGEPLTWSISDLWATGGRGQVFLGHRGTERFVGLDDLTLDPACGDIAAPMSFASLVAFAACTGQVIDGLFVGAESAMDVVVPRAGNHVEHLSPGDPWFRAYPLVVHAFDSTHWRMFLRDDAAAGALRERFTHSTELARW
jgi:hypothetical protein